MQTKEEMDLEFHNFYETYAKTEIEKFNAKRKEFWNKANASGNYTFNDTFDFSLKSNLIPKFLNIFGFLKWRHNFNSSDYKKLTEFKKQNILPDFFILKPDDIVSGVYNNVNISIAEVDTRITSPGSICIIFMLSIFLMSVLFLSTILLLILSDIFKNYSILGVYFISLISFAIFLIYKIGHFLLHYQPFRGILIDFTMNKNFSGHTFFHENVNANSRIRFINRKKYSKVNLEDIEFNKKYTVYSDNQIEARYLLTTAFMDRFLNLKTSFNAKWVRASFKNNKLSLAISTDRDMFKLGFYRKDTDINILKNTYDEIWSLLHIVDCLKLNTRLGL